MVGAEIFVKSAVAMPAVVVVGIIVISEAVLDITTAMVSFV